MKKDKGLVICWSAVVISAVLFFAAWVALIIVLNLLLGMIGHPLFVAG